MPWQVADCVTPGCLKSRRINGERAGDREASETRGRQALVVGRSSETMGFRRGLGVKTQQGASPWCAFVCNWFVLVGWIRGQPAGRGGCASACRINFSSHLPSGCGMSRRAPGPTHLQGPLAGQPHAARWLALLAGLLFCALRGLGLSGDLAAQGAVEQGVDGGHAQLQAVGGRGGREADIC